MTQWIWQSTNWPHFTWDLYKVQPLLGKARLLQGKLLGTMQSFNEDTRKQLNLEALTEEMITTSAIEGEAIDRDSVRSSIYHRLGIDNAGFKVKPDRYVEGLLDIMLDAAENHAKPLDMNRLFSWQAALFPTGYSGIRKILVGQLRGKGNMEIVSGQGQKVNVHYLAPPHDKLKKEMKSFLHWFNVTSVKDEKIDGLVRAAIAHFWFEKIHPFDDGNGRIGRAIIDMALAQDEQLSTRFYSISSAIMSQRKGYYNILDIVSKGDTDVTVWVEWFINCFINAMEETLDKIQVSLLKSQFWQMHMTTQLNDRQRKVLNKMLDKGAEGYKSGMTTRKYVAITKTSRATAYRELHDLVEKKCLKPSQDKGRSSAYDILYP